ncbi:hypothetical protein KIW84_025102 [Lathyrus oleraceus]|uniref:Uncharacterized protein n=1 Tax=Pisum sativum TaxID=3888 RepID=A0A9D5BA79_PEA|nr:hypothetical protein KIW84_025102 [Pisum sativum]
MMTLTSPDKLKELKSSTNIEILDTMSELSRRRNKFEADQSGWYCDGRGQCTKSVSLKDGKLKCFSNNDIDEPVLRYKLKVQVIDSKYRSRFVFWDNDCFKMIEKTALKLKTKWIEVGEDNPLAYPYALDAILKKEFGNYSRLSIKVWLIVYCWI